MALALRAYDLAGVDAGAELGTALAIKYDLESLVSPALAAALLTMISFHNLFFGTVLGFIASALLVLSTALPEAKLPPPRRICDRITRGTRI